MSDKTQTTAPSTRDLIRDALCDAIGWQEGLADAYRHIPNSPEHAEALAQARRYRTLLKRRYGNARTPIEQATDNLPSINMWKAMTGGSDVS